MKMTGIWFLIGALGRVPECLVRRRHVKAKINKRQDIKKYMKREREREKERDRERGRERDRERDETVKLISKCKKNKTEGVQ